MSAVPRRAPGPVWGRPAFFGEAVGLAGRDGFAAYLAPLRKAGRVVDAKRPFGGSEAGPASLSRSIHRVAISNSRLIRSDEDGVNSRSDDYRARGKTQGQGWVNQRSGSATFARRNHPSGRSRFGEGWPVAVIPQWRHEPE